MFGSTVACGLRRSHAFVPLGEESVAWVLPPFLPSGGLSWLRGGVGCHVPAFRVWGPFPGRRSNRHPPRAVWTSVSLSVVASSPLSVCSSHARPLAGPGVSINILKRAARVCSSHARLQHGDRHGPVGGIFTYFVTDTATTRSHTSRHTHNIFHAVHIVAVAHASSRRRLHVVIQD